MSQNRAQVDGGANDVRKAGPGDMVMDQKKLYNLTTVGNGTIPPEALLSGIINRTGPTAGFADTFPSASSLLAANPIMTVGDAFEFLYLNGVAFAGTGTANADGSNVLVNANVTASLIKRFLVTVLADGANGIYSAGTVNATTALQLTRIADAKNIRVGMGVTGTGVGASAVVTAVNINTGVVTVSVASTSTNALVALTFVPRIEIRGLYQAAA